MKVEFSFTVEVSSEKLCKAIVRILQSIIALVIVLISN